MSDKEILRGQLMLQLQEGKLDQRTVAERLGISTRQVRRLLSSYSQKGVAGLLSKRRDQPSNHRIKAPLLQAAMDLIGNLYRDFGPTFAAEKLAERHNIKLSVETVRKSMIVHGYWKPKRGQAIQHHPMRERRAMRGELIQIDGSPHDWFEGRSPKCCLLVFIDDATSELMHLQFVDVETTLDYMAALEQHILRHGLPAALYSDKHSIFRINAKDVDANAQTQFARALEQLGIAGIHAHSPQAKGRVERVNQTLQDRLIKELRLEKINNQGQANVWLPTFINDFNRRFAVVARSTLDAHVPYLGNRLDLQRILSLQEERTLSKNLSCQVNGKIFQVKTQSSGLSLRGATVSLHHHQDGRIELLWRKRPLAFEVKVKPVKQSAPVDGKAINDKVDTIVKTRKARAQSNTHPWKKSSPKTDNLNAPVKAMFDHSKTSMAIDAATM